MIAVVTQVQSDGLRFYIITICIRYLSLHVFYWCKGSDADVSSERQSWVHDPEPKCKQ